LLSTGAKNYKTVKKLEFSSFSNALNINTGKLHPTTYHERHREGVGVHLYFFFHLVVVKPTPRQLNPRERDPVLSVYGAGGPRDDLDGCRKYCLHADSNPEPSNP
jgi:hypothetical protein